MEICTTCGHPHHKRICRASEPGLYNECGCEYGIHASEKLVVETPIIKPVELVVLSVDVLVKKGDHDELLNALIDALGNFEQPAHRLTTSVFTPESNVYADPEVQVWADENDLKIGPETP